MRTRSQSRNNFPQQEASPVIVEPLRIELPFLEDQSQEDPPPEVPMAENQTMAELLQAPTEGYEDAIIIPEIAANNFELKYGLINLERFNDLLSACPHHGFFELHQLDTFYNALNINDQDSLNSSAGGNFLDKMPRECLKIIESKSKVRQSRAKAVVAKVSTSPSTPAISSDFAELKDMVKALLLDKKNQSPAPTPSTTPAPVKAVEPNCVTCGGAHAYQNCPVTHENAYRDNIQEYVSQAAAANYNQGNTSFRPQMVANQIRPPGQLHRPQVNQAPVYQAPIPQTQRVSQIDFESYVKANDAILRNMQSQGQSTQNQSQNIQNQNQNLQIQMATLTDMMSKLVSSNTASSSGSGTLPGNTITNPKEELKGITSRSSVAYQGPKTPSPSKQGTEVTKDQVQTPSSQNTEPVQPSVIQSESQALVSEPVVAPVGAPMPNLKPSIPYPSRHDNEKRHDQVNEQIGKFYKIFKDMSFKISFTDALTLMPKFASTLKALIGNKEKLNEMARTPMNDHCSAVILNKLPRKLGDPEKFHIPCEFPGMDECLALADLGASINLMPFSVWEALSLLELTPTCMTLKLADRSVSKPIGIAKDVSFKVGTFQRCMLAIFHDMVEKTMEVFMDDFSVFRNSFENCLSRLDKMLQRCEDTNLSLNWEKSHFMVKEGIVLGHKISKNEIEVDRAKSMSLLNYFIPQQSKDRPFELMCDASDFTTGAVLGQRHEKHFKPIHYASKTMNDAKTNYTTTEKEMLAVVYTFEKFRSYLIMNKSIVHTDHSALKYLFAKKDAKARLLRWVLLLQEFDFKVLDTKGAENLAADYLFRLENPYEDVLDPKEINETFPLETLSMVTFRGDSSAPWFADFANYHAGNFIVKGMTSQQKNKFFKDVKHYFWDDPF
nr:reverse transcriptase domain-containing protein [Tanacetum cinerariifolium]